MRHETIIPLIGGVAIASENVYGVPPERIYSYNAFSANDSHLLNYYQKRNLDIPYTLIDNKDVRPTFSKNADVISTVCPCAGLSTFSSAGSADNPTNDWMVETAQLVLGKLQPQVFWGENAPTLAGGRGEKVRKTLFDIAQKNGYTMMIYKTKSLDHGLPQYRQRSFYFFFKEKNAVPQFNFYKRDLKPIEELLDNVKNDYQGELTNTQTPTDHQYYKFILEEMHPGMTHAEFIEQLDKSYEAANYIRSHGVTFADLSNYFEKKGNKKEVAKCMRREEKLSMGKNIMTRSIYFPRHRTGAFVGHLPKNMTHHRENRYLTYRECMAIMGLPEDFELLNPKRNLNHVCQNVPVSTATDMAAEVYAYLNGQRPMLSTDYVVQSNSNEKVEYESNRTIEEFFAA